MSNVGREHRSMLCKPPLFRKRPQRSAKGPQLRGPMPSAPHNSKENEAALRKEKRQEGKRKKRIYGLKCGRVPGNFTSELIAMWRATAADEPV